MPVISVEELAEKLRKGENFILLDVREPHELEISRIDPCLHIPMSEVIYRSREFQPDTEICVLCRTGNRSGTITQALKLRGFSNVRNVAGGINAYAMTVDPNLEVY